MNNISNCILCCHQMVFDLSKSDKWKRNATMTCSNCKSQIHFNTKDEKLNLIGANYRFKLDNILWNFWYHKLGNFSRYTKMTKENKEQLIFAGLVPPDQFERRFKLKAFW